MINKLASRDCLSLGVLHSLAQIKAAAAAVAAAQVGDRDSKVYCI